MHKTLLILLLLFSLSSYSQSADKLIAKGTNEAKNQRYDKALILFNKAIEISPTNVNALVKRGLVNEKLKNYHEAIEDYNSAVNNGYDILLLNTSRARCYYATKQYQDAISDLNLLISNQQKSFEALLLRGIIFEKMEQYHNAINDLNAASELHSRIKSKNMIHLHSALYWCYFNLKRYEEAYVESDYIIKNHPSLNIGYTYRGNVLKKQKEYLLAINDYNKSIELKNDDKFSYLGRAYCYKKSERYNESLTDYLHVLKLDTNNKTALAYIPQVKTYLKDYEGALKDCEKFITKFDSNDINVGTSKGIALKHLKRYNESLQVFNKLIEENLKDEVLYNQRADLKLYMNDLDGAILDVNQAIQYNPQYITSYITKAEILYKLENYDEMCDNFNKAIALGFENNRDKFDYINKKCNEK